MLSFLLRNGEDLDLKIIDLLLESYHGTGEWMRDINLWAYHYHRLLSDTLDNPRCRLEVVEHLIRVHGCSALFVNYGDRCSAFQRFMELPRPVVDFNARLILCLQNVSRTWHHYRFPGYEVQVEWVFTKGRPVLLNSISSEVQTLVYLMKNKDKIHQEGFKALPASVY